MSKKWIIISLIIVFVAAVVVVGILFAINSTKNTEPTNNRPIATPGETVPIANTPDLKTCEILPVSSIQEALGESSATLTDGERGGVIAHNGEVADSCNYAFTTADGTNSKLSFEVYPYTSNDVVGNGNVFDQSWLNITNFEFPDYTLPHNAYYKQINQAGQSQFTLQVVTSTRHYKFAIIQPQDSKQYSRDTAINILISLATSADYQISEDPNAPPAPETNDDQELNQTTAPSVPTNINNRSELRP